MLLTVNVHRYQASTQSLNKQNRIDNFAAAYQFLAERHRSLEPIQSPNVAPLELNNGALAWQRHSHS